ncbi:MAG: serine hydrolase [Thermomicrobiales bacterium]
MSDGTIIDRIEAEFAGFPGSAGVAALNLGTGERIEVNASSETATASTIKVPILIELMRRVELGEIALGTRMAVPEPTPGSGVLRDLSREVELSLWDYAVLMIAVSDNTATNLMIDLLGIEAINRTMRDLGFPATRLLQRFDFPSAGTDARKISRTTPADLAGIMDALATGRILTPERCQQILRIMGMQHYRDLAPRYLPFYPYAKELGLPVNNLRIANKTGGWHGMRADMALVEWPGVRYVIGIVTEGDTDTRFWSENQGDQMIGRVSRLIFDHWGGSALDAPADAAGA